MCGTKIFINFFRVKNSSFWNEEPYTKTPVTTEAIKVPRIANVTMAPKFEKKGFWEDGSQEIKAH